MFIPDGLPPETTRKGLEVISEVVGHVEGRRVCIQAGGCLGLWPTVLAESFEAVYTFEADRDNFNDMSLPKNVYAFNAALGDRGDGFVDLDRTSTFRGGYRVEGEGVIPTVALDSFNWPAVDLIWLDIEGSEPRAINGAVETIARHRPWVCMEAVFLEEGYLDRFCRRHGYRHAGQFGYDALLAPGD